MVTGGLIGQGAQGFAAPVQVSDASILHSGEGAPDATLGTNGDFYFRNDAASEDAAFYVKVGGVWTLIGAGAAVPSGVKVSDSNDQVMGADASLVHPWDTEVFDLGGWHDTVTNNSRLTVPAGFTNALIGISCLMYFSAGVGTTSFTILKNGAIQLARLVNIAAVASDNFVLGVLDVGSATDYYELNIITVIGVGAIQTEAAEGASRVHFAAGVV